MSKFTSRSMTTTPRPLAKRVEMAGSAVAGAMITPAIFSRAAIWRYFVSFFTSSSELHSTTEYPASCATSSTARAIVVKKGFSTSGTTRAITSDCPRRRERAVACGTYPNSATAVRTASARSSRTGIPFSTRETVAVDTPARSATSRILVTQPSTLVGHVRETREVTLEGDGDRRRRAVSMFRDDEIRFPRPGGFLLVQVFAVDEHDHVSILFDRAGLPKVTHLRSFISSLLAPAVELGDRDHGYFEFLGEEFDRAGELRDFLLARFHLFTRAQDRKSTRLNSSHVAISYA